MKIKIFITISFIALLASCRQIKQKESLVSVRNFIFLDSIAASKAIVIDDNEHFFAKINALDVSIQMKDASLTQENNYLNRYQNHLKKEVSNFSETEKTFLTEVLSAAEAVIQKTNKSLLPKYKVAKIKTGHYGEGVYYTRGEVIYVPDNIFIDRKLEVQVPIMIHELWHVISEMRPDIKEELYGLIGFKKHNLKIQYPPQLEKVRLTNPDGADDNYAVFLPDGKLAIPLILSDKNHFQADKKHFMSYLKFDLYGLDANGKIECGQNSQSLLSAAQNAAFFALIKDNTQYIIHPDEIIADNFMLATLANDKDEYSKFTPEGKKLINAIIKALKMSK